MQNFWNSLQFFEKKRCKWPTLTSPKISSHFFFKKNLKTQKTGIEIWEFWLTQKVYEIFLTFMELWRTGEHFSQFWSQYFEFLDHFFHILILKKYIMFGALKWARNRASAHCGKERNKDICKALYLCNWQIFLILKKFFSQKTYFITFIISKLMP